jgi:hypothetical protein
MNIQAFAWIVVVVLALVVLGVLALDSVGVPIPRGAFDSNG